MAAGHWRYQIYWAIVQRLCLPHREWRRLRRRAYAAQQQGQMEVAGLMGVDQRGRIFLVFVNNESSRACHFEFGWEQTTFARRAIHGMGGRCIGMFHSHPISEPIMGAGDIRGHRIGALHLIYDVCGAQARLWQIVRKGRRRRVQEVPLVIQRKRR